MNTFINIISLYITNAKSKRIRIANRNTASKGECEKTSERTSKEISGRKRTFSIRGIGTRIRALEGSIFQSKWSTKNTKERLTLLSLFFLFPEITIPYYVIRQYRQRLINRSNV